MSPDDYDGPWCDLESAGYDEATARRDDPPTLADLRADAAWDRDGAKR